MSARAARAVRIAIGALTCVVGLAGPGAAAMPAAGAARSRPRPLEFDSEVVRIVVQADSVEVNGFYRFLGRGPAGARFTVLYPFPNDSLMGGARMVSLVARVPRGTWQPVDFAVLAKPCAAAWRLPTDRGDTLEVAAVYRQALRGRSARYIVTSADSWSRRLRSARFELVLPTGSTLRRASYPFHAAAVDGRSGLVFEATDFLPERDVEFAWGD